MPVGSVSITTNATTQQGVGILSADTGYLEAVYIAPETGGTGNAEAYAQVFISSTEGTSPLMLVCLCSGYIGANHGISWTGRIKLEPSMGIYAIVWNDNAFTYRLTALTEV